MSASNDLFDLYRRWRLLSEAEGEAIRLAAWPKVEQCQAGKHELQDRILVAVEAAQAEVAQWGSSPVEWEGRMRKALAELITLETRNGAWLAEQRERARAERENLDRSRRSLRRVHQAYAGKAQPAWHSYS